jgi:putative nucleotidyltransferase with HDIG domain
VVGSSAIEVFTKLPNRLVNMQDFWEHSLYAGIVARLLSRYLRAPNTERCFIMGLLHDIGSLVMYHQQPELSRQALDTAIEKAVPLHLAEREIFGFDHGEVGAQLMRVWNLPESFSETALHHHQPTAARRYRLETATVHLADVITGMAHSTASGTRQVSPLEPGAWELTGLTVDIMEPVVAEADAQFEEACAALLPGMRAA